MKFTQKSPATFIYNLINLSFVDCLISRRWKERRKNKYYGCFNSWLQPDVIFSNMVNHVRKQVVVHLLRNWLCIPDVVHTDNVQHLEEYTLFLLTLNCSLSSFSISKPLRIYDKIVSYSYSVHKLFYYFAHYKCLSSVRSCIFKIYYEHFRQ